MYTPGASALLSLALAAALFLPGAWVAVLCAERFPLDAAGGLALAFAAGLALTAVSSGVAWMLGLPLVAVAVVLVGGSLASVAVVALRRGRVRFASGGGPGLLIAAGVAVLSLFQGQEMGGTADQFYHLAAMRSLLETGRPLVTDPFYGTASRVIDPTSGAWHSMGAAFSLVSRVDVIDLVPAFTAATAVVFAVCLWSLFRRVSGDRVVPAVTTIGFLGIVQLFDFRVADYPNSFSWMLAVFALVLLARLATAKSPALLVAAVVTGFAVIVTHVGSAELYVLGGASVALWALALVAVRRRQAGRFEWAPVARVAGALGGAVLLSLPLLVPRLSALKGTDAVTTRGGTGFPLAHFVLLGKLTAVSPLGVSFGWLIVVSLPLLVLAAVAAVKSRDQRAFLALALGSLRIVLLYDPLAVSSLLAISPYMTARLAGLLVFAPFCVLAWGMGVGLREHRAWVSVASAAALLLTVVLAAPQIRQVWTGGTDDPSSLTFTRTADVRTCWGSDAIPKLRAILGPGRPLVAAYPHTGMQLAAIADVKVLAVPQSNTPAQFRTKVQWTDAERAMLTAYAVENGPAYRDGVFRQYGCRFVVVDTLHFPLFVPLVESLRKDPLYRVRMAQNGLYVFEAVAGS